mmetsp:Transcript_9241/g.22913  ORF Transcript_9241/g.22913 Transcript_9241/m.22913 type:complete len:540 (+) Transcript_9241:311-1930(+)
MGACPARLTDGGGGAPGGKHLAVRHLSGEARELEPVGPHIHHVVAQAEVGEGGDALAAREASLLHLLVPLAVVAGKGVLPRHEAPLLRRLELDELHQVRGLAAGPLGDLGVGHLEAREVKHDAVARKHLRDGTVAVAVDRPVVPSSHFCRVTVGARLPVNARHLGGEDDVCALEDVGRVLEHLLPVPDQRVRVPLEEKVGLGGLPDAPVLEELRVLGGPAVDTDVVGVRGPHEPEVGLAALDGGLDEVLAHVAVITLKLARPRESPVLEGVRRVAHLSRGPEAYLGLDNDIRNEVKVPVSKRLHQVPVHLERGPAEEHPRVVRPKRQVLRVAVPVHVRVPHVVVQLPDLEHPGGQRHGALVAHVAPALVEAHDRLELQPNVGHRADELVVPGPVVHQRALGLHDAPPYVRHDALAPRALELDEPLAQDLGVVERVVLGVHRVQRQHHEERHLLRPVVALAARPRQPAPPLVAHLGGATAPPPPRLPHLERRTGRQPSVGRLREPRRAAVHLRRRRGEEGEDWEEREERAGQPGPPAGGG